MFIYNNIAPDPLSSHYLMRYKNFIENIKPSNDKYTEVHHIIPRCLGGSDTSDNLIPLTPREHFLAHWMLWKAYGTTELTYAFFAMCNQNNPYQNRQNILPSKTYQVLRERYRSAVSNSTKALWQSEVYREKHKATNESVTTQTKRSEAAKRLWADADFRNKQTASRKAMWASGKFKRDHSKCGMKGDGNPSKRPEVRAKNTGGNHYTKREGFIKPVCEHCGKDVSPSNYKRWHGDRCKFNPA